MTKTRPQTLLQMLLDEHQELCKQIDELRQFWDEVDELGQGPKYEEMGSRVRELRELLAKHFADEERGGYLAPALERSPQFRVQAEQLKRQHQQLFDTLNRYIDRLQTCESTFHCWQEVRTEFEDFLRRLHEHEAAETAIVETASGNEISTAD
jgi:hemerythrin